MGDKCERFHVGTDDEVRSPNYPKYADPEWVVSRQSGMLVKYNNGDRSLSKAEWKMVLYHAEQAGNGQIWHSDQTPPGESYPIQTRGLNESPRAERKAPSQPANEPQQDHWPEPQHWDSKKDWSPSWEKKGWNKLDVKKENWSQSSGAAAPSATAPQEVKEETWEDDGHSVWNDKDYKEGYNSKGEDWKKAEEEMKPEPQRKVPHFVPPPPPASPRATLNHQYLKGHDQKQCSRKLKQCQVQSKSQQKPG